MSAAVRNSRDLRLPITESPFPTQHPLAKSVRLSQLRKIRQCEQVAAVCYRVRRGAIEVLLVQTRGSRRWIFPKGSAEPGLTHAQAAALEAFEEAGVHGRIEESSFARYVRRGDAGPRRSTRSAEKNIAVSAHLCEVMRLCTPKESNRNRTWFSVDEAKYRLRNGRENSEGNGLARVVDKAVVRIQQLHSGPGFTAVRLPAQRDPRRNEASGKDALQKVQFEAPAPRNSRVLEASLLPNLRRQIAGTRQFALPAGAHAVGALSGEVLQFKIPAPFAVRSAVRSSKLLAGAKKVKAPKTAKNE
jgi:8-oxo-dGTP pyrophosphatase MutT (NUDIX family)